MAKAVLLAGKIASGKSHYAQLYARRKQAMILSCDDLFLTLFDGCLGDRHREMERRAYQFFYRQAVQLVRLGIDALLDFGFWTAESRAEAVAFFSEQGIPVEIWYFETEDSLRKQRLAARNQRRQSSKTREYIIDEAMLARFDAQFEPPGEAEHVIYIKHIDK